MRLPSVLSLLLATLAFFIGVGMGMVMPTMLAEGYLRQVRSLALQAYMLPPFALYLYILSNNVTVALIVFLSGFAILPPLLILFFNGLILGAVARMFAYWYTLLDFLRLILPHGIIEIPAFIIASAAGLDLAADVISRGYRTAAAQLNRHAQALLVVIILLAIAAAIETMLILSIG